MASRSWFEDIDDEFCKCPICRQIFEKPIYLPCLHRYCSLCLKLLIGGHQGSLPCPECEEEFSVPENGVDELKPDCFTENIVRYIKLVSSFEINQTRDCFGCSKLVNVTSYCFRCDGFLCNECERIHSSNRSIQDHQSQTLPMVGITENKVTLAQVFAAMESTCCSCTPKNSFSLCHETFRHNLRHCLYVDLEHDVNIRCVRQVEREADSCKKTLLQEIKYLTQFKDNIYKMPFRLKRTKEMLESNVRKLAENLLSNYEKEVQKRKEQIEKLKEKNLLGKAAADKDDKLFDGSRRGEKHKVQDIVEVSEIEEELKTLCEEYERLSKELESKENDNERSILEISKQVRNTIKQFNNFEVTAKRILSSNSNWVLVHCSGRLCSEITTVSQSLISKMKEGYPKLETLSHIIVSDPQKPFLFLKSEAKVPTVSATGTSIGPSELPSFPEHVRVYGFNDSNEGKLVIISGRQSNDPEALIRMFREGTYLSGINLNDCNMPKDRYYNGPYNCDIITSDKIVILFHPNIVTMYNVSDISNVTSKKLTWTEEASSKVYVPCFAVDHVNKNVYLPRSGTKLVYVLDEDLKHLRTLILPLNVRSAQDMILKRDYLIICDMSGEAYAFFVRGSDCILMFQFEKPPDISIREAASVCTDKRGFIYILWKDFGISTAYISQYSQCGHHLLKTTRTHNFNRLRIRDTKQGEQLLMWSVKEGIYVHDLNI